MSRETVPSQPSESAPQDSLTVVVPAYNEAENIGFVVDEIFRTFAGAGANLTINVVDDGSSDSTKQLLHTLSEQHPIQLQTITHAQNLGLGAALRTGFINAGTSWVGWLPADGQFAAADLAALYQNREGVAAVTGRVHIATRNKADNWVRVALSLSLRAFMRILHPNIPDFNGIMVVRRDLVPADQLVCRTGFINMEILDRIRRTVPGSRVHERAVSVRARRSGSSKVANTRTILTVVSDLIRLRMSYGLSPTHLNSGPRQLDIVLGDTAP